MKRLFDLMLAALAGCFLLVPVLMVAALVRLMSKGSALYWSDRVGRNNTIFKMPKFRSMQIGTPAVATHLLSNPDVYLTPIGSFSCARAAWTSCRSCGAFWGGSDRDVFFHA